MANTTTEQIFFEGFEEANTTPIPDVLFDQLLSDLSGAELKALLYIMRRTRGFKKDTDPISFNQFMRGITKRNGEVLDRGCGVKDRTTLSKALKSLEERGYIQTEKGRDDRGENTTTLYRIRFKGTSRGVVGKSYYPSRETLLPVVGKSYPQETEQQQTDLQYRDISRSTALEKSGETARPPAASLTPITSLLTERKALLDQRKNNRSSKTLPPEIDAAIRDISTKLSDLEHIRENISQAANLYRAWGGVNGSSFVPFVYEACAITRQQPQVKKQMPYFFQVLKGLLGLSSLEEGSIAPG